MTRDAGGRLTKQPLDGEPSTTLLEGHGLDLANINETATDGLTLVMLQRGGPYTGRGCRSDSNGQVTGFPSARFELVSIEPGGAGLANPYPDSGDQRCQQGPSHSIHIGGGRLFWLEQRVSAQTILSSDLRTGEIDNGLVVVRGFDVTQDGTAVTWGDRGITIQRVGREMIQLQPDQDFMEAVQRGTSIAAFTTAIEIAQEASLIP